MLLPLVCLDLSGSTTELTSLFQDLDSPLSAAKRKRSGFSVWSSVVSACLISKGADLSSHILMSQE